MISVWTNQEISSVLLQLEQRDLLFPGYTFCREEDQCRKLGSGSYALVFDALDKAGENRCCIKVTGFGEKREDPEAFRRIMAAQKLMGSYCANIVKIYKYTQLYVQLDGNNRVVAAEIVSGGVRQRENCLLLQFILMEKLVPVLTMVHNCGPVLCPQRLADGDEGEVLLLGEHIANALAVLHDNKILHRDIKLENIFYDPPHGRYKLGDFGIAKATLDGMAHTAAFTKGYGAPEIVGMPEDRYDGTADIYSLGIVLFVLLNELRFPDSDRYHVNVEAQYCPGYVLPDPACGSKDVAQLIRKMCAYNPDDRPQSMKEVGIQLDRMGFSPTMRSWAEDGKFMALLGVVVLAAGVGTVLLWFNYPETRAFFDTVPWLSPLLLLQGIVFLCQGLLLVRNELVPASVRELQSRVFLAISVAMYGYLILASKLPVRSPGTVCDFFLVTMPAVFRRLQVGKVGIFGLLICGLWWLRDRARRNRRNRGESDS